MKKSIKIDNNEDMPAKLISNVVISRKLPFLPPDYSILEKKLAYNKK